MQVDINGLPCAPAAGGTGAATAALQTAGNTILSTISTTLSAAAASLVTIVTNTTSIATSALQTAGNTTLSTISTTLSTISTTLSTIATNTTGASTAANQSTANTSLSTIATNSTTEAGAISAGKMQVTIATALPAGTALIGKTGIDQTTPGTTNGVQVNAALPAGTNVIGKAGIDQTTPGTTNGVQVVAALPAGTNSIGTVTSLPNNLTIVALDVSTVTTGGTAVSALTAGHRIRGGWLQNPKAAGADLCINEQGTASGTVSSGATICIVAGQSYYLTPSGSAVSVISSDSSHPFAGQGYN